MPNRLDGVVAATLLVICFGIDSVITGHRGPALQLPGTALDVPPVTSPPEVVEEMIRQTVRAGALVADLGCGDGRIAIAAAKAGARAVCVERDPVMMEKALHNAAEAGVESQITFKRTDLRAFTKNRTEMERLDVIMLYLSVELNEAIRPALERNLRTGARVVSHAYPIPGWTPLRIVPVHVRSTNNITRIFVYEIRR